MAAYRLTREAENDLIAIYLFGIERFGHAQADRYYDGLVERLEAVAAEPQQFPSIDELRQGYRRAVYGAHAIYFRDAPEPVLVVRILGRQRME